MLYFRAIGGITEIPVLEEVLWTQIERILHSEALRGSEAQRSLLKFLGEKSLLGGADQLKEYSVGVDALGKATYL